MVSGIADYFGIMGPGFEISASVIFTHNPENVCVLLKLHLRNSTAVCLWIIQHAVNSFHRDCLIISKVIVLEVVHSEVNI